MGETNHREVEELARKAYDTINRGDREGFVAMIHPDVVFYSLVAEAEGKTFRGHDGVREWWDTVAGLFKDMHFGVEEIVDLGDRGFARLLVTGTMAGVVVPQRMWQAFIVRDGKPVWWRTFRTEAEARASLER